MTSWEDLPDDCWQPIINRLELNSYDLRPLSSASKRCYKLTHRFRTTLTFPRQSSPVPASHYYARFPNLTTLLISRRLDDLDGAVRVLAAASLPLRRLGISSQNSFPGEAMSLLGSGVMRRTLVSLACTHFRLLTDSDLSVLAGSFSYLRHLYLSDSVLKNTNDEVVGVFFAKFASLLSFGVWLGPSHTGGPFGRVFLHDFLSFAALSTLYLDDVWVTEAGLVQLAGARLKLRKLTLWGARYVGNVSGAAICNFFKSCSLLAQLSMWDFDLPSDTVLPDFAASIPNLEVLMSKVAQIPPKASCLIYLIAAQIYKKLL